jgi:hypothetical protein
VSIEELPESDLLEAPEPAAPDPMARIREDIGDLELFGTAWKAAAFSASVLSKSLRARAVIIHAVDAPTSELRIVAVKGASTSDLLGETAAVDDDFVGSTVTSNGRPLKMTFDRELPRVLPSRFATVRAQRSLVAVPLIASGRCVGLIEVVDVAASAEAIVTEACALVADRLLSLFSQHGPIGKGHARRTIIR